MTNEEEGNLDWALAVEARQGSAAAFAKLAMRWWAPLYRFAWNMSGNASFAGQATERALLAAIRSSQPPCQSNAPFEVSLYRLALRWTMTLLVAKRSYSTNPRGTLREALERLDPLDRAALLLRETEGLSTGDVAAILATSTVEVRMQAHRALTFLTRSLDASLDSDAPPLTG